MTTVWSVLAGSVPDTTGWEPGLVSWRRSTSDTDAGGATRHFVAFVMCVEAS